MNFLAHLYLSGPDPDVMTGNFIGDFVKGRQSVAAFPPKIISGIELHRAIDTFTDSHPVVAQSKKRLWATYRHYSGVIVDMYYDHFLAVNWSTYSPQLLPDYADHCYDVLEQRLSGLPEDVQLMLPYMIRGNWLVNYARLEGIQRALGGMARRTRFDSNMDKAVGDLREHYAAFGEEFAVFFQDLSKYASEWRTANRV